MIPIASYQAARRLSYVALTRRVSPGRTRTRQFDGVAVIATSHETGPLLSQYLASDRNRRTEWFKLPRTGAARPRRARAAVAPFRTSSRSVNRPPGGTGPAGETSVPGVSTFHSLSRGPPE